MNWKSILFSAMLMIVILLVYDFYFAGSTTIIREATPTAKYVNFPTNKNPDFTPAEPTNFISAAKKATPSVVSILSTTKYTDNQWKDAYSNSSGSGVILSEDGYIVTNMHVLEKKGNISVTLHNNKEYKATLVGTDISTDLGILKINAENLTPVSIADSDDVQVGEWVMAVGNPLTLNSTVTAGIVSAKSRNIDILDVQYGIESFIQTDAAVNKGNSGGALVNTEGKLIGINTAIITYSGRFEGYSFAIPSRLVYKVYTDIIEYGTVLRGFLGIEAQNVNQEIADKNGLKDVKGVFIDKILPSSGAEDSDLKKGDIIIQIDDRPVSSLPEMMEYLALFRPGKKVQIKYFRTGNYDTTQVTLKNKLNNTELVTINKDPTFINLGIEVRDLLRSEKSSVNTSGVKVVAIYSDSKISKTKMDPGFIITKVNDIEVNSVKDLNRLFQDIEGRIVLEGVYERYQGSFWYVFMK